MKTFQWHGGPSVHGVSRAMRDEPEEEMDEKTLVPDFWKAPSKSLMGSKALDELMASTPSSDVLWNRQAWRARKYSLLPSPGEHPCFAGYERMIQEGKRCNGFVRKYPDEGTTQTFQNSAQGTQRSFTLSAVVGKHINVWLEEGYSPLHREVATQAARIYSNDFKVDELRPTPDTASWMEHECKVMGTMPFMYTCSNRINILVQECGVENAWVMSSDFLSNFPFPANNDSGTNFDIIFYMCKDLIESNPNPYSAATTFAHELAHVIQGGFGYSSTPMMEGGATWLEGPLLHLPPRPMTYAWGFKDWNYINAAHIYATSLELNSRKFYQIHAMFLSYLSQEELLGNAGASALQNYQSFLQDHVPFGRGSYDYFLSNMGRHPSQLQAITLNVSDTHNAFANALLDFRVALASQCITDAFRRPVEARYLMPVQLRDRPMWDCTSFPTFWSGDSLTVTNASMALHYGGAAIFRLTAPQGAQLTLAPSADPRVRTKVLAAGSATSPAEVQELAAGQTLSFPGAARELFVVQVNVDPEAETLSYKDMPKAWRRSNYRCKGLCRNGAWTTADGSGQPYPPNIRSSIRSPLFRLPDQETVFSFAAMWDIEPPVENGDNQSACKLRGYDGAQVRVQIYDSLEDAGQGPLPDGDRVAVLHPQGTSGYGGTGRIQSLANIQDGGCSSWEGWAGAGPKEFTQQSFSLAKFAGQLVRLEIVFASDAEFGGEGFWASGLEIRATSGSGDVVLWAEQKPSSLLALPEERSQMSEHILMRTPRAGQVGSDGVPIAVGLPPGHEWDIDLSKADATAVAPWSAIWEEPSDPEAALRRAYMGKSYSAPIHGTHTAQLREGQEACIIIQAPFAGQIQTATLFTLVDKTGIRSVSLTARDPERTDVAETSGKAVSPSPGIADPGVHRFELVDVFKILQKGERLALCVSAGDSVSLPSDVSNAVPFLHLPLTNAAQETPNSTFLLATVEDGEAKPGDRVWDPWDGLSLALRAEFVEVVPEAAVPRAPKFLAKKP